MFTERLLGRAHNIKIHFLQFVDWFIYIILCLFVPMSICSSHSQATPFFHLSICLFTFQSSSNIIYTLYSIFKCIILIFLFIINILLNIYLLLIYYLIFILIFFHLLIDIVQIIVIFHLINYIIHLFIYSFIYLLVNLFIIYSFVCLFIHLFIFLFTLSTFTPLLYFITIVHLTLDLSNYVLTYQFLLLHV